MGMSKDNRMPPFSERKFVNIGPCTVAYRQWGENGKPVVLLHGIPMNSTLWERTGTFLAQRGYLVYAPEMLGLGYSEGPIEVDHSLRGQAELFGAFIDHLIKADYILVGHDLGGGVVQIIVTELATKVDKCVFTNCVAFDSWPVEGINLLIKAAFRDDYAELFTLRFVLSFLKRGLPLGVVDRTAITGVLLADVAHGLVGTAERVEHLVRFLRAMDNKYTQEASPKLNAFAPPTLVLWAQDDRFQPVSVAERLRAVLPKAAWETVGGGHFHPLEHTLLAEAICRWENP